MSAIGKAREKLEARKTSRSRRNPRPHKKGGPVTIDAGNLRALQAIYFAAMLEELKGFQVMDRVVQMFSQGLLPLGRGRAAGRLYRYWRKNSERLTETQRRDLYARAFGFPSGDAGVVPNREFQDLWMRFLASVSSYARQITVEDPAPSAGPPPLAREQVRRTGRDLAANLSLHGYGLAFFAARELQSQVKEIIDLLSDNELLRAFGARNAWEVIHRVASTDLGASQDPVRYRTMGHRGSVIIRWLSNRRHRLLGPNETRILNDDHIRKQRTAESQNKSATVDPTDFDLVNACEQWLAVYGTPDTAPPEHRAR